MHCSFQAAESVVAAERRPQYHPLRMGLQAHLDFASVTAVPSSLALPRSGAQEWKQTWTHHTLWMENVFE